LDQQVLIAFLLTLFAGLSTGIGSAIALLSKRTNKSFLSVSLGLSAGVMIYVSFVELLPSAISTFTKIHSPTEANLYATISFFVGIVIIMIIDKLVPEQENPHEMKRIEDMNNENTSIKENENLNNPKLMRVGVMTALLIAIHNFPEGMVTFISGLENITIALPIAIAIAIHNIPEGISVSVPIYFATGSKKKAFWLSFTSGLAEPIGAIIAYFILAPFLNDNIYGIIYGIISGIMVYISLDELLPAAEEYGEHHLAIYGLIAGMAIMAISLILL